MMDLHLVDHELLPARDRIDLARELRDADGLMVLVAHDDAELATSRALLAATIGGPPRPELQL